MELKKLVQDYIKTDKIVGTIKEHIIPWLASFSFMYKAVVF